MAFRELKHLQLESEKLSPEEKLELANFLIASAKSAVTYKGNVLDLNAYAGTVSLDGDPLEYQRSVRAEWP